MILVPIALVMIGGCLLAAAAGYGVGREEVIQSYEDEIALLEQEIDALIPAGVRIVER